MNTEKQTRNPNEKIMHIVTMQELSVQEPDRRISKFSFANWIRVLRQNWRQGSVSCKGRSDVSFTNKKPWKQKGTGRARVGSARSPLWRGGGVIFGPQPRVKILKMTKKMRKKILRDLLFSFLNRDKILCVDWVPGKKCSTSAAYGILKRLNMVNHKITLFVPVHDKLTYASFANIAHVRILYFDQSNAFDLVNSDCLVFLKKDLELFKGMVSQWM